MPAPTNANGLSLGRPVIDPTTDDTATLKELLAQHYIGAGFPCGARDGDDVYMAVYAQSDGGGAHILYGGNPTDPTSPHVLTVSAAGSATIIWQEEDSTVITSGTANFVGAGVTVTDEGDGKATITIPGGGVGSASNSFETWAVTGGGSIVADSATDTATFTGGTGITITADSGADSLSFAIDTSEVAQVAFKFIEVSGQTTVEADSSADTLTLVAGSNMTITTSGDTITFASTDTNTTYTAGAGVNLGGTKFSADPNNASHVGLVDPSTGADSTADDAQIGLLWHEIANYDSAKNMLIGHAAGDTTKPVIEYKTVVDWLETLPDWSSTTPLVLISDGGNDGNEVRWATISEMLSLLTGYTLANEQSIGKDTGTGPEWQDDDDECP